MIKWATKPFLMVLSLGGTSFVRIKLPVTNEGITVDWTSFPSSHGFIVVDTVYTS